MNYIQCKIRGGHSKGEISRKYAGASSILKLAELIRKIRVQHIDRVNAIAQITVHGTEEVVETATTAEFPKSEGTPSFSGSVSAL